MAQEIILNILLFIFLLIVLKEDSLKTKDIYINKIRKYINTFSLKKILLFIIFPLSILVLLIVHGNNNFLSIYIYTTLSILVLFHALWLSKNLSVVYKTTVMVLSILVVIVRIFYPTVISHDLFVMLTVVWLGPFITSFRFFTEKMFVCISLIWFCYDIFYVWITSSYQVVSDATNAAGFPLSIFVNNASIGLADLFFASLLVALIKNFTYKLFAIILLIGSNITLAYYANNISFITIFPLLVLWVPCGLLVLFLENLVSIKKNQK